MALKDLLVIVDSSAAAAARIDYAAALAERHDAHLTGLFVKTLPRLPAYILAEMPVEARRLPQDTVNRLAEAARSLFEGRTTLAGRHDRSEWRVAQGDPDFAVGIFGRYADLVIAGQIDPGDHDRVGHVHLHEMILGCGRPVLVVPYAFRPQSSGDRVLVAWNASREAARAVADALPLLEAAKQVTVLAINPGPTLGDEPGADITLHLARHGVRAEAAQLHVDHIEVGEALLSRAADLCADLIVMGAYGTPRLREMVLGGVTRHILQNMTVPVLMSH